MFFKGVQTSVNSFRHNVENGQTYFKNIAVQARHFFKSMFGHFSILCMKGLAEHYLNPAFIPVKSQCRMVERSI